MIFVPYALAGETIVAGFKRSRGILAEIVAPFLRSHIYRNWGKSHGRWTEAERQARENQRRRIFRMAAGAWPSLDLYGRFEQAMSLVLIFVISGVIFVAVGQIVFEVARDLLSRILAPIDLNVFQEIFGMIMTVLIALEFNHTILGIFHRKESIVQLRTVILIAILAIARKFIIIDITTVEPLIVMGLALTILALGCVFWLLRGQDRRRAE